MNMRVCDFPENLQIDFTMWLRFFDDYLLIFHGFHQMVCPGSFSYSFFEPLLKSFSVYNQT